MKITILILLSALVPLAPLNNNPTEWITRQVPVEAFEDLTIETANNIVVLYNEKNTLQINGEGQCVESIKAYVSDNKLHLSTPKGFESCKSEIIIGAPVIKDINVKNGGIVNLTTVSADTMFASIEDGGVISLDAKKFLYGKIKGSGIINYKSDPFIYTDIIGEGEVKKN